MDVVTFLINGKVYKADASLEPYTSLNKYIRNHARLKGTKAMCHEGGCGACIVSVRAKHPLTKEEKTFAVNSCLVSVFSCHGWSITTVEGLGNRRDGYHSVQSRLAGFNGTQCGFCSPGWVMNMYSLLESSDHKLSMKEVENSFAGNMCRCTGYRPILDAFKSFAGDCDKNILNRIQDIEDMSGYPMCKNKEGVSCTGTCHSCDDRGTLALKLDGMKWFKVDTIDAIFNVLDKEGTASYMLVAGNTAQGVYHMESLPSVMIDISDVSELKAHALDKSLHLGGGMSLNEAMDLFKTVAMKNKAFKYLDQFYNHLDLVAHIPVRNIGTIAGNLSIKHAHPEFPSDVFLLLETVSATITLLSKGRKEIVVSLLDYLETDMKGRVIKQVNLPALDMDTVFHSYKIMPRAQNAHAHINAGFLLKFFKNSTVIEKATIVFGAITSNFIHATTTERLLVGKDLSDSRTLEAALVSLSEELMPEDAPPEPSPQYRRSLSLGLFYKFILRITPQEKISSRLRSGGDPLVRPVSSGRQSYDTNKKEWPLRKPIPKVEALVQCSGEAEFVDDIPVQHNEVYVAFVLSSVHAGKIDKIDASEALNEKGVVAFFTAKDIPGDNNFMPPFPSLGLSLAEEILSNGNIKYNGQPIAIITANSTDLAQRAAKMVRVTYKDVPKSLPVLTIKDAMNDKNRVMNNMIIEAKDKGDDVVKTLKGSFEIYQQYHYTMETQSCVCAPVEDGLNVFSALQWLDYCHLALSKVLKMPQSQINLRTRRLGGAYGLKVTRAVQITCATALAARLLNRPARMVLPLIDTMKAVGKRLPLSSDYELSVNKSGEIQALKNVYYQDNGCSHNESVAMFTASHLSSCYDPRRWYISGNSVLTDLPSNTWCRGPGSTEGIALTETIMEQISVEMCLDPVEVRLANMSKTENPLPELIDHLKKDADYVSRSNEVKQFNKNNRWKKRGIALVPMTYPLHYFFGLNVVSLVSIYHGDGTVTVTHGGIEMGQGLNTKVAQACAFTLGIPLSSVVVKPTDTHTSPNAMATAGSVTSEICCYATINACRILLKRLEPIRQTMESPKWKEITEKAYASNVPLSAQSVYTEKDVIKGYDIHGVTITEVEIDVLTGNHQIRRVDLLEDTGESLSPEVDVGQVEGSFVMGLGYWTSETIIYDKNTGENLTNRTWNYKPPGVKDIPIDFRVQFRKNAANPNGILRSKATGEPPLCMAVSVAFAIRQAVTSAREDAGEDPRVWYNINFPYTPENVLLAIGNELRDFKLQ